MTHHLDDIHADRVERERDELRGRVAELEAERDLLYRLAITDPDRTIDEVKAMEPGETAAKCRAIDVWNRAASFKSSVRKLIALRAERAELSAEVSRLTDLIATHAAEYAAGGAPKGRVSLAEWIATLPRRDPKTIYVPDLGCDLDDIELDSPTPPPAAHAATDEGEAEENNTAVVRCYDCGMPYGGDDWLDSTLPPDQWAAVMGRHDGGGILCANCIVRRASRLPGVVAMRMRLCFADDAADRKSAEAAWAYESSTWGVVAAYPTSTGGVPAWQAGDRPSSGNGQRKGTTLHKSSPGGCADPDCDCHR